MPSIQRKYVWDLDRIEQLFDSILKGYPIGTFLIWNVSRTDYERYVFYRIKSDFNFEDGNWQEKRAVGWDAETWALLDGQQRLTSLSIGFRGEYTYKPKGSTVSVTKKLYYNLIAENPLNKKDYKNFKFLEEEAAKNDPNNVWVRVESFVQTLREFSNTSYLDEIDNYSLVKERFDETITIKNDLIKSIVDNWNVSGFRVIGLRLYNFARKIHDQEIRLFNYYLVNSGTSLDTCTEIFVRINSGGQALSRADLLFSTVVSKWERGREVIDKLLIDVSKLGFSIDSDFVMRASLFVTKSEILFNVKNFDPATVDRIINAFERENSLGEAIKATFKFVKEKLGLTKSNLKSLNVLIPVVYHYYCCNRFTDDSVEEIKKYIFISLLQKVFGSHGDTLLKDLLKGATNEVGDYKFIDGRFNYSELTEKISEEAKIKLFKVDSEWVDKVLGYKKGNDSALVLSLIYGRLPLEYNKYDQDHLHPKSKFKPEVYTRPPAEYYRGMEDLVPNLGFLTPDDNRKEKRAKSLAQYYETIRTKNPEWYSLYKSFHKIDSSISLEQDNFIELFNARKNKFRDILIQKFSITPSTPSSTLLLMSVIEEDEMPEPVDELDIEDDLFENDDAK
jgi:uncharacterized protein with ParB-like and HNH nuclease domain